MSNLPRRMASYFQFLLSLLQLLLTICHCSTPQKSETLTPTNTNSNGARVMTHLQEVKASTAEWQVTVQHQYTWQFILILDNSWGFDPDTYSSIAITINSNSIAIGPSTFDSLLYGFTVDNSEYFTTLMPMDNNESNHIYPACSTNFRSPTQPYGIGDIASLPQFDRSCDIANGCQNWQDMEPTNLANVPPQNNGFPVIFLIENDPKLKYMKLSLSTDGFTGGFVQECAFLPIPTNRGLTLYMGGNDPGQQFNIQSFKIESWSNTNDPSKSPTNNPTDTTFLPTKSPTNNPTDTTFSPTKTPTNNPTYAPTPALTHAPSTITPTLSPTVKPRETPTFTPTINPSNNPSVTPTKISTIIPTFNPTAIPTTLNPTTAQPTDNLTQSPTNIPTTLNPTTKIPSIVPTYTDNLTQPPTNNPILKSTKYPTPSPSDFPFCNNVPVKKNRRNAGFIDVGDFHEKICEFCVCGDANQDSGCTIFDKDNWNNIDSFWKDLFMEYCELDSGCSFEQVTLKKSVQESTECGCDIFECQPIGNQANLYKFQIVLYSSFVIVILLLL